MIWNPMNMAVTCQKKKRKDQNVSDFFPSSSGFLRRRVFPKRRRRRRAPPPQKNMHHHFPPPTVILWIQDNSGWLAHSLARYHWIKVSVSVLFLFLPSLFFSSFLISLLLLSFESAAEPGTTTNTQTQPVLPQLSCHSNAQEHTVPKEETRAVRLICFFCADSITTRQGRTHYQPRDHTRPSKSQTNQRMNGLFLFVLCSVFFDLWVWYPVYLSFSRFLGPQCDNGKPLFSVSLCDTLVMHEICIYMYIYSRHIYKNVVCY